jgi:hypothetical protein
MLETMGRIRRSYADGAVPPPVLEVQALVEGRDYDQIRARFSQLWTALTEHHRARGEELQPRVAHNFRIIDTLVRSL